MEKTATPNSLATVIQGSLTSPIVCDDLLYGTFVASFSLKGNDARNISALRTCTVELTIDGKTSIGSKLYDAQFICNFARSAMVRAFEYFDRSSAKGSTDVATIRSTCRCQIILHTDIHAALLDIARLVADFYRDLFQKAVETARLGGNPIEFDAPNYDATSQSDVAPAV